MAELTLKVVLCHLLSDFVFQSKSMLHDIAKYKLKSKYLYFHPIVHFLLLLIFTSFESIYFIPVLLLSASHLLINIFSEMVLVKKIDGLLNLITDQLLHVVAIFFFVKYFYQFDVNWKVVFNAETYLLLIALLLLTVTASHLIKRMMSFFNYVIPGGGLQYAGKIIGILERLFIFLFIVMSFWEGIGFLLAAKSIFRFGDLKEGKDVKLTEYILIGTLVSFGLAISIAVMYLKISVIIA